MAGKKNIFANFLSKSSAQADEPEEAKPDVAQSEEVKPVEAKPDEEEVVDVETGIAAEEQTGSGEGEADASSAPEAFDGEDLDEIAKLKRECEIKDARIAALEKQVSTLEDNIAQWSANLSVVKQGYEALEKKLADAKKERDRLDGVRLSLERANARLVEQNNLLRSGIDEPVAEGEEAEGDDVTATVKYEVLYTPPDPEIHEALEGSDFFSEGEEIKPPEFHMPNGLFRR